MEIVISVIPLIVSVLALFVAIFVGWWVPNEIRIMDKLSAVEPEVYFGIGHYGGPAGHGVGANIQNRGNIKAHDLALYLPWIGGLPVWSVTELEVDGIYHPEIPLANDTPARTRHIDGLVARLVYHNRYGMQYTASLNLVQEKRDDGFYNIRAADGTQKITRPVLRFRDKWKLRERV